MSGAAFARSSRSTPAQPRYRPSTGGWQQRSGHVQSTSAARPQPQQMRQQPSAGNPFEQSGFAPAPRSNEQRQPLLVQQNPFVPPHPAQPSGGNGNPCRSTALQPHEQQVSNPFMQPNRQAQPSSVARERQQQMQQMQPYAHPPDPFRGMDDMMLSPFGGLLGGFGGGPFGGGPFGGIFGHMDRMMQEMDEASMGSGGVFSALDGQAGNGMMMSGMCSGGGGGFSCQTMMFSSGVGRDGQVHTEKFSSSAVGDVNGRMREVQQAYSNSSTGVDKMSLERQLEGRGRKMVKEMDRTSGEERSTNMFRGMTEEEAPQFDQQWREKAVPRLPQHPAGGAQRLMYERSGYPAAPPMDAYRQPPAALSNGSLYSGWNR